MSPNLRGALFMCIAMAGFTINDTFVKWALESLTLGQIILMRGMMAFVMLILFFYRSIDLSQLPYLKHPAVITRMVGEVGATLCFLLSLSYLPIAFVTSILQALPLLVTLGAAFFFSEPVGWRRWSAIIVGFIGILIIVRPGFEGFTVWSLVTVAAVIFCAIRDLATRVIPKEMSTANLSTATALVVALVGGALIEPFGGWQPVTTSNLAIVFTSAVALIIGYYSLITAMRQGDISFMAPFRFTGLLWAILLGYVIFGDLPDRYMLIGASIIICSGLYALYRERVVNRQRPITESTSAGMAPDGL